MNGCACAPVIWSGKFTAQGATGTVFAQYWNGTWTIKREVKAKGNQEVPGWGSSQPRQRTRISEPTGLQQGP